ncbi:pyruvoyl-dependent arginine decarboxylase [Candidatus Bathyarchaeota archaeon]|nr:MAG: pyruvoyl-dependent arginine decarboxylase [Candidatus Bathyarchaeota archaeon]
MREDLMIPKAFFVTGGKAIEKVSSLNAFDLALKNAGIANCNLVSVSSIIPPNCKEVSPREIPIGSITYAVIAKAEGRRGIISAGIAWGIADEGFGVVAEAYGSMDENTLKDVLKKRILEMANIREINLRKIKYRIESLDVPEDNYGCVVAALVYLF